MRDRPVQLHEATDVTMLTGDVALIYESVEVCNICSVVIVLKTYTVPWKVTLRVPISALPRSRRGDTFLGVLLIATFCLV